MHPFQFMTDDQLIAGLNDFAERAQSGEVDDTEIDSIVTFVDNKAQNMQRLMQTGADIRERGVCQADLARLEEISPGVTAGLNSGDYTFLASQHGLEAALNAIDWKAIGSWGIVGVIIAAIIALIVKIRGGREKSNNKNVNDEITKNYNATVEDIEKAVRNSMRSERVASPSPTPAYVPRNHDDVFPPKKPENKPKVFNKAKAVAAIQAKFKNSEVGIPKEHDILRDLPITQFQKLDASDTISNEDMAKIYSFCFHYGLNSERQKNFLAFDTLYGKKANRNIEAITKLLSEDLLSSDVLDGDLTKLIECMSRLDSIYKDDFTLDQYKQWQENSDGKGVPISGIIIHIDQVLRGERTGPTVSEIIKADIELSMSTIAKSANGGFYNFSDIARPSYVAGSAMRPKIMKHLDIVEKEQKEMAAKIKKFETLSESLLVDRTDDKNHPNYKDLEAIKKSLAFTLRKANISITAHHRKALASVQGCSDYIRYGDVGVETFKILSKMASSIVNVLLDCYEKPSP